MKSAQEKVLSDLQEMQRTVLRKMPHVGCRPEFVGDTCVVKCNCYKSLLLKDLCIAENSVREALGLDAVQ